MKAIIFADLPVVVKVATFATYFIGWVLFAEFIIDRHGLDRYLPFYRVGNLCVYDLGVAALLVVLWFMLHRRS